MESIRWLPVIQNRKRCSGVIERSIYNHGGEITIYLSGCMLAKQCIPASSISKISDMGNADVCCLRGIVYSIERSKGLLEMFDDKQNSTRDV